MINSDLNNKPFFIKDKEGEIWAQASLSTTGPYIYTNGVKHFVMGEADWDDYSSAAEDLGVVGATLAGGMLVRYTASDLAEALNDVTVRLDLLRRRMVVPIKVLSREEFHEVMNTENGLDYYASMTLSQADGHLGVFREEIDRGAINTEEEGSITMPVHVYGSVMLYKEVLEERMDIINDDRNIITLTPAMNENDLIMFVVYGEDQSSTDETEEKE